MRPTLIAVSLVLAAGLPVSAQDGGQSPDGQFVEHNGTRYRVTKDARGERTYWLAGRAFTHEQLRAHVAGQTPRVLTSAAEAALAGLEAGAPIDLVLVLRHQPAAPIAREVWAGIRPAADGLAARIRDLNGRPPRLSLPGRLEHLWPVGAAGAAQQQARLDLSRAHDDLMRDARREIHKRIHEAVTPGQDAVVAILRGMGGQITARVAAQNIVGVRIAAGRVAALARDPRIASIDIDHAGAPELDNHKVSLGLTTGFWPAGITGGVHDAGILDTGVAQNHPSLSSHRFLSNMGTNDTQTHGTGMAGILASTHPTYTGMAFGLDTIVVALAGSITTSMPGLAYIASTGEPESVNYSFGNGTANGQDYTPTDQFFDGMIHTFGFMVSKSTGNGGYGGTTPTITHPAPAFNLLASANMEDFNTVPRADDRINSSSSRGPTTGGRKKPDITAPGNNSMSCHPGGGFANIGGTSSASPHTGAGFILLWDMGVMNVKAAKAILLNTTDAITDSGTSTTSDDQFVQGSLWNRRYGWGYLNLGAAFLHGNDFAVGAVADAPPGETFALFTGQMFAGEKATLVWERHVAASGSSYPTQIESLSDLDLLAYSALDGAQVAQSVSAIDNVEQLHAPADGAVILKVKARGAFDPQIAEEEFGLAMQENFVAAAGPAFGAAVQPVVVQPGAAFELSVQISNTGDLPAHNVSVQLSGVTVTGGANPAVIGSVIPGTPITVAWTVEAAAAPGPYALTLATTSDSYGETFAAEHEGSYTVAGGVCYPNCDGSSVAPVLNVADFTCFLQRYAAGESYANCDQSTVPPMLNVADFVCFLSQWASGCR